MNIARNRAKSSLLFGFKFVRITKNQDKSSFLFGLKSVKMTKSRENGQNEALNSHLVGLKFVKISTAFWSKICENRKKLGKKFTPVWSQIRDKIEQ